MAKTKESKRAARHSRIRKHLKSASDRPRLCVHRSLKNIFIQVIDDQQSKTLLSCSTLHKEIKAKTGYAGNINAASILGEMVAQKLKEKNVKTIIFDRGGYLYHGRVKAVAEGLRKGGIVF